MSNKKPGHGEVCPGVKDEKELLEIEVFILYVC
jgi:hypothetical protein